MLAFEPGVWVLQVCGPLLADGLSGPCRSLLSGLLDLPVDFAALHADDRIQNQVFRVHTVLVLRALHSHEVPLCFGRPKRPERSNLRGLPMCNGGALLDDTFA